MSVLTINTKAIKLPMLCDEYGWNRFKKSYRKILTEMCKTSQWSKDGKGLYFQFDDQGKTKLGHISLSGKVSIKAENLGGLSLGRPYNEAQFSVSDKDQFAYTLGTPEHPADLALTDGKGYEKINLSKRGSLLF